jgi:hypothetical protein
VFGRRLSPRRARKQLLLQEAEVLRTALKLETGELAATARTLTSALSTARRLLRAAGLLRRLRGGGRRGG